MITPFRRTKTTNDETRQIQDAAADVFASLVNRPLLDGALLTDIAVSTTPILVDHKLGRAFVGWIIVRKSATADVWEDTANNGFLPLRNIALVASAATTISLWVF